jgi:hypothetical protein
MKKKELELKLYDVVVTSRNGRVWRYQVEGFGKSSARKSAFRVKQQNKYRGRTSVYPVED